tara:strand:+ start:1450 stop:3606 length:2157 start_codon:yes stop_codon:yes gene_type:complete
MLENIILVNLAICLVFGIILVNRNFDLSKLIGSETKSLGVAFLLLMAFTINLMPLVSAADGDGDGVEDADDECPDTVTQEGWTVADNGCSYPSYLDSVWMCIGGGIMVQDLSGDDEDECSVSFSTDGTYMTIVSTGIGNHDMEGGVAGSIEPQDFSWKLPLVPTNNTDCDPNVSTNGCEMAPVRGPVATAVNGVPFYGPEDGPGGDAVANHIGMYVEDRQEIELGLCGAHMGPGGYHYHYDGNCMHWHGDESDDSYDVSITDDMKFNPDDLTINVGDTITWTNDDNMAHTATSTSGPVSFDSGNIASGATWSFTFTQAGTYDYKCAYHSSMTASITVVEPEIVWTDYDFSKIDSSTHSPIIGFAFDGYPIYGAYGSVDGDVTLMKSNYILKEGETGYNGIDDYSYSADNGGHLDACNGIFSATPEFPDGIYHYHSTMPVEGDSPSANNAFPYFINCYRGVAEDSNTNGGGGNGGGQNGPPDDDGDHVGNGWDMCADTGDTTYPDGDPIYPRGCTESQFNALSSEDQDAAKVAYAGDSPPAPPDEDGDGIPDPLDDCEGTESGNLVYSDGCAHESTEENEDDDNSSDNETAPDADGDGVADDDDSCPNEDSSSYDADADGCIDDSDSDGVKDDADICPFDANDGCPAALANEQTEGECVGGDVKNEDCNTCTCEVDLDGNETWVCSEMDCAEMKEDTPGFGIFAAIVSCIIVVFRRKLD